MPRTLLMTPQRVRRALVRMAYEIVERNRGGDVEVFGVRRRGLTLARFIAATIEELEGRHLPVHPLDVAPFRDDLPERPPFVPIDPPPRVEGRHTVIVDDVLFTGRTARAALDAVMPYGRPASIQLAVLVDRGHREVPLRPDYLGRVIPTKYGERVVVEVEGEATVYLDE